MYERQSDMYFDALVEVIKIEKNQERPGFLDKYHILRFSLRSEEIISVEISIWVHANYPDEQIIKITRTFLHRRLLDFVELTSKHIYLYS